MQDTGLVISGLSFQSILSFDQLHSGQDIRDQLRVADSEPEILCMAVQVPLLFGATERSEVLQICHDAGCWLRRILWRFNQFWSFVWVHAFLCHILPPLLTVPAFSSARLQNRNMQRNPSPSADSWQTVRSYVGNGGSPLTTLSHVNQRHGLICFLMDYVITLHRTRCKTIGGSRDCDTCRGEVHLGSHPGWGVAPAWGMNP